MNGVEAAEKMCLGILRRKRESKEEEEDLWIRVEGVGASEW